MKACAIPDAVTSAGAKAIPNNVADAVACTISAVVTGDGACAVPGAVTDTVACEITDELSERRQ